MPFSRIAVAVDFSHHANAAAALAIAIARRGASEIVCIHVEELPGVATMAPEPIYIAPQVWESVRREHREQVSAALDELCADVRRLVSSEVKVRPVLQRGETAAGILDVAADHRADVIVIGSEGASATTRLFFGSVAEKVVHSARCPVLVTRAKQSDLAPPDEPLRRILVAVDHTPLSVAAAKVARKLAPGDGCLDFVFVWHAPMLHAMQHSAVGKKREVMDLVETYRRVEVDRLAQFIADNDLSLGEEQTTAYIEVGSPARGICRRAEEVEASLVVVGAHGRQSFTDRLLGGIADRVLRNCPSPVLLVPERTEAVA